MISQMVETCYWSLEDQKIITEGLPDTPPIWPIPQYTLFNITKQNYRIYGKWVPAEGADYQKSEHRGNKHVTVFVSTPQDNKRVRDAIGTEKSFDDDKQVFKFKKKLDRKLSGKQEFGEPDDDSKDPYFSSGPPSWPDPLDNPFSSS